MKQTSMDMRVAVEAMKRLAVNEIHQTLKADHTRRYRIGGVDVYTHAFDTGYSQCGRMSREALTALFGEQHHLTTNTFCVGVSKLGEVYITNADDNVLQYLQDCEEAKKEPEDVTFDSYEVHHIDDLLVILNMLQDNE